MKKPLHIAVVGGGAAGLVAAICAARRGAHVTVLERQERVGRKILATGNGRCNLTNRDNSAAHYHGADPDFYATVLQQLPVDKTLAFFSDLGLCTRVEEEGRIFPVSGQAAAVLDLLRHETARLGVEFKLSADVNAVSPRGTAFRLAWQGGELQADRVIIAAGGRAMPQLGGSDGGMRLLEALGHAALPVFPALVPLRINWHWGSRLKGLKVMAGLQLVITGRPADAEAGEILFAGYGLSGPPVIQLSLAAGRARLQGLDVELELDLFPDWELERLRQELAERFSRRGGTALDFALVGLLHKRLIAVVLQEAGIAATNCPAGDLDEPEIRRIATLLKKWRLSVSGSLSWSESHVMAGGIRCADFNAATLESKIVEGLFAAGEVLDIVGDCGGHNLQWAWSSGFVAGSQAAKE